MATEPESRPRATTFYAKVGERITVDGTIFFSPDHGGCWALLMQQGGLMQLAELPPEYQRDGLRVSATVHMEPGQMGDCVPGLMLFVDSIEVQPDAEE